MQRSFVKVGDVTHAPLQMVNGLASVQDAIEQMKSNRVSSLVIERRHEGDEFGLITVLDIAEKVISQNRSTERTSVYEVMTKPALTVNAEMNVKYAIRLLSRLGASRALVTDREGLIGLVTLRDLIVNFVETARSAE